MTYCEHVVSLCHNIFPKLSIYASPLTKDALNSRDVRPRKNKLLFIVRQEKLAHVRADCNDELHSALLQNLCTRLFHSLLSHFVRIKS